MQWMMNAMERVKMSREPAPRMRSALTTNGKTFQDLIFLFHRLYSIDVNPNFE